MRIEDIHSVYFIGVGGIGMSAIARYFHTSGKRVAGYDRVRTELTSTLEKEGIEICYRDDLESIPEWFLDTPVEKALVVYTPAVPKAHSGLNYLTSKGYEVVKRSKVLNWISAQYKTIAVAGTHGKTTTSSLVTHLISEGGKKCSAFLGGISTNLKSNVLSVPDAQYAVIEADEFDRSFLNLNPYLSVITSIEADHLDIYGTGSELERSFADFAALTSEEGIVFLHERVKLKPKAPHISYALESESAMITTKNLRVESGRYTFELVNQGKNLGEFVMNYPGRHNVENALPAIGIALHLGIDLPDIKRAVESFAGVKRRFEYHIQREDMVFIDDYAHHPTEIKACLTSVKELYPGQRITGIFQPHLYSRTRDFGDDFARSLEDLHDLLLMEIYPAREEPIPGINSQWLLDKVRLVNKKLIDRDKLVEEVLRLDPEVLLTLGAGDIDRMIEPLKNALDGKDETNR